MLVGSSVRNVQLGGGQWLGKRAAGPGMLRLRGEDLKAGGHQLPDERILACL